MGKTKIKSIGVIISIMILLSSTQAELNDIGSAFCKARCVIKCAGELPRLINSCLKDCIPHCDKLSFNPIDNCVNNFPLMKFITDNIGGHDLVNVMNTCMQECEKKL